MIGLSRLVFLSLIFASAISAWKISLRGRLFHFGCSHQLSESLSTAQIRLVEFPSRLIGEVFVSPFQFPIPFVLKFSSDQIDLQKNYFLEVFIRDENDHLIYRHQARSMVIPIGEDRTMFIDIPLIEVKPSAKKTRWPELVGMNGEEAVRVIQKETDLLDVRVVLPGRPVTMDYRNNRVRVFVDEKGLVSMVPIIA